MATSAGGADSMGNAPQPQDPEFQGKSNLYATRDKPGAQDKSKIQDHGVPVDSARTGIEIVFLGKDSSLREDVHAFLSPTYLVVADFTSVDDLLKELPSLTSPRPAAIYISMRYSPEEQDNAEKRIGELNLGEDAPTIVKGSKADAEHEKYKHLERYDVVPRLVKDTLDSVKLRDIPANAAAITENAV